MQLIFLNEVVKDYTDIFRKKTRKTDGHQIVFLDPKARFVQHAPHRVPESPSALLKNILALKVSSQLLHQLQESSSLNIVQIKVKIIHTN